MMGLVGLCGSNATIGNKGVCQLASSDSGQVYYSSSMSGMSSTTATSVHYTCDPSNVFPAWHGDSHPPKGQTIGKVRLASFLQPAVLDFETVLQRSRNAWYWRAGGADLRSGKSLSTSLAAVSRPLLASLATRSGVWLDGRSALINPARLQE